MGLFDDMLKDHESLFLNPEHLDFDYQPKIVKHRETHQQVIAEAVRPLLHKRNGKNLLIHGPPGVGKTVTIKHVLQELEETGEDIYLIYLNCWKKETAHKIALGIAEQIEYKWIQNKNTEELMNKIAEMINKKTAVFILDEFDKLEDHKILYNILEEIYKKTIIMITNEKDIVEDIDPRVLSRLTLDYLEYENYTGSQIRDILEQRMKYAFVDGVFTEGFDEIVQATIKTGDLRTGLFLLKEAGNNAEMRASRKIELKDVEKAIGNAEKFAVKKTSQLTEGEQEVLEIIKNNKGKTAKELFDIYGGEKSFRTFQRILNGLTEARAVTIQEIQSEQGGMVRSYNPGSLKTLNDY